MKPTRAFLLAACATLLAPTLAGADIPPDPDSDQAHCSEVEQCPDSAARCDYNNRAPNDAAQTKSSAATQACAEAMEAKGLAPRCSRGGNYIGRSLYYKPNDKGSWRGPFFGLCAKRR